MLERWHADDRGLRYTQPQRFRFYLRKSAYIGVICVPSIDVTDKNPTPSSSVVDELQEMIENERSDLESVFGNIKNNPGFRWFMLPGKEKIEIAYGLIASNQNMRKRAS